MDLSHQREGVCVVCRCENSGLGSGGLGLGGGACPLLYPDFWTKNHPQLDWTGQLDGDWRQGLGLHDWNNRLSTFAEKLGKWGTRKAGGGPFKTR